MNKLKYSVTMLMMMIGVTGVFFGYFLPINAFLRGIVVIICFCSLWGGLFYMMSYANKQGTLNMPKDTKKTLYFLCLVTLLNTLNSIIEDIFISNIITLILVVCCFYQGAKVFKSLKFLDD